MIVLTVASRETQNETDIIRRGQKDELVRILRDMWNGGYVAAYEYSDHVYPEWERLKAHLGIVETDEPQLTA